MNTVLTEIVDKKRNELNRHKLVAQLNKQQEQKDQQFYLKQLYSKKQTQMNDVIFDGPSNSTTKPNQILEIGTKK